MSARGATCLGIRIDRAQIFLAAGAVSLGDRLVIVLQARVQPLYGDVRFLELLVTAIVVEIGGNEAKVAWDWPAVLLVQLLATLVERVACAQAGVGVLLSFRAGRHG